jgi:hypothetical protein
MPTIEELQVEADRRAAELSQSGKLRAADRAKVYEEINRRESDRLARLSASKQLEEESEQQRLLEAQEVLTPAGRILACLEDITKATESTADSLRQIRNAIAFLLVLFTVVFILQLLTSGHW